MGDRPLLIFWCLGSHIGIHTQVAWVTPHGSHIYILLISCCLFWKNLMRLFFTMILHTFYITHNTLLWGGIVITLVQSIFNPFHITPDHVCFGRLISKFYDIHSEPTKQVTLKRLGEVVAQNLFFRKHFKLIFLTWYNTLLKNIVLYVIYLFGSWLLTSIL